MECEMTEKEIGRLIKERRKHLGINQQMLADLAAVGINTIVAIERGDGNPKVATLISVLDTLGLEINLSVRKINYETV